MRNFIVILSLLFFSISCNYKLFVSKDRVYNTREGYLLFLNKQKIFFPAKNIKGDYFFELGDIKSGYIISYDKEDDALYSAGEKYAVDYSYEVADSPILVRDTIVVLPVIIGSMPYSSGGRIGKGLLTVKHDNKTLRLEYANTNGESVWSVTPLLKEDKLKATKYYD